MIFKKINPKEKVFHYIEIDSSHHVLYDSILDVPIVYGSKAKVSLTIKNLNKAVKINYYNLSNEYIKLDKVYDKR